MLKSYGHKYFLSIQWTHSSLRRKSYTLIISNDLVFIYYQRICDILRFFASSVKKYVVGVCVSKTRNNSKLTYNIWPKRTEQTTSKVNRCF